MLISGFPLKSWTLTNRFADSYEKNEGYIYIYSTMPDIFPNSFTTHLQHMTALGGAGYAWLLDDREIDHEVASVSIRNSRESFPLLLLTQKQKHC